jgi:2-methylisocitrate lyase-like PEP mutase family enzyme
LVVICRSPKRESSRTDADGKLDSDEVYVVIANCGDHVDRPPNDNEWSPDPGARVLPEMGFSIVLYANAALQAALKASYEVFGALKATGSLALVAERLASFEERQRAVAKDAWDQLEARYRT